MLRGIDKEYFEWLLNLVCRQRISSDRYTKLLMRLHNTEFRYSIRRDRDRADDGENLRYRFARIVAYDEDVPAIVADLDGPCTVLEMMVALALRCEECNMDDPDYGNRTGQWFWGMIVNLGLGPMVDSEYDDVVVDTIIQRFLDRRYDPDGKGGLFRIRDCDVDLRRVEIWHQLCWYLDTIV